MVREAGDSLEPFPGFGCQTDVAGVRPGFDFGQSLVAPAEKEKDEVRHQTATIILTVATRLPILVP
jgi:hypothetical protein